jgi:hypothetical protein
MKILKLPIGNRHRDPQHEGKSPMRTRWLSLVVISFIMTVLAMTPGMARVAHAQADKGKSKIAEEAFIYGFPMVMNYAVFYKYFIDKSDPSYKAPLNQIWNAPNVFTYKDTAIVTPNSDTPYSFIGMDLRAEPYVICNPEIEKSREKRTNESDHS